MFFIARVVCFMHGPTVFYVSILDIRRALPPPLSPRNFLLALPPWVSPRSRRRSARRGSQGHCTAWLRGSRRHWRITCAGTRYEVALRFAACARWQRLSGAGYVAAVRRGRGRGLPPQKLERSTCAELVKVGATVRRGSVEFAMTVQHAEWLIRVWEGA